MLVALLCVLLVSVLANVLLEGQFRSYVRESQERSNRRVADLIGGQHRSDGTWDDESLAAIGMNALEQGVIVRVTGGDGVTVWDAMQHNSGLCEQMISHMARNMESRYRNWRGGYTESAYPVRSGAREVGSVSIGSYGPFFFNDEDLSFINALNRLLAWVALGSLALALTAGLLMARGISEPIGRVVAATQDMAAGNLGTRLPERTRVREIDQLTAAANELAGTLQAQQGLRRRLTADMAHELRTPLATLQSHLEALIDGVWEPDQSRLGGLHAETLRMSRLIADLEDLARYEGGSRSLSRAETDIRALVAPIVREPPAAVPSKGSPSRPGGGRFGRVGVARRGQGQPGSGQPAVERPQVHSRGRNCRGAGDADGVRRRDSRQGHRDGHCGRRPSARLRATLQGRLVAQPHDRRIRHRALHHQGDRRGPRRDDQRDERARQGLGVHDPAPPQGPRRLARLRVSWLPRDLEIDVTIEARGLKAAGRISTFDGSNTCITTMRLRG